jgi:hypothetical protein
MKLTKEDLEIPFDIIHLPSQGLFYDDKKSSFMVRYLSAREENVLTSPSLIENGMALNIVLNSVIMEDINVEDLLIGDRNLLLIYLRSTSYGDSFNITCDCPNCNKVSEYKYQLSALEPKEIEILPNNNGLFQFTLPNMKIDKDSIPVKKTIIEKLSSKKSSVKISFKPLTVKEEAAIDSEIEKDFSFVKKNITARYIHQIKNINGCSNRRFIENVIKVMPIGDSVLLREYMDLVEPGINTKMYFECPLCRHEFTNDFKIDKDFFGLTPEYRQQVMEEVFLAFYYGKGITKNDAYNMSVTERRWTINRIGEEIEKRNKAEEKAARAAQSKR